MSKKSRHEFAVVCEIGLYRFLEDPPQFFRRLPAFLRGDMAWASSKTRNWFW